MSHRGASSPPSPVGSVLDRRHPVPRADLHDISASTSRRRLLGTLPHRCGPPAPVISLFDPTTDPPLTLCASSARLLSTFCAWCVSRQAVNGSGVAGRWHTDPRPMTDELSLARC